MLDAVQPDLLVAEHSPSALLAAHCLGVPAVLMGVGFTSPPRVTPFPDLRPWLRKPMDVSWQAESRSLAHVNELLRAYRKPTWPALGELLGSVKETFLFTIPELDPYAARPDNQYYGSFSQWGGKRPVWPEGKGKRIWGYLKPFPALAQLLAILVELRAPTIIVSDGIDPRLQRKFARPWLRFENEPLNMQLATRECDVAICNANHGTSYALLSAGKPALYLPLHLEQTLTAHAVMQRGLGLAASVRKPEQIAVRLPQLVHDSRIARQCQEFSSQLSARDPAVEIQRLTSRVESVLKAG
jgi:hypothetical protein